MSTTRVSSSSGAGGPAAVPTPPGAAPQASAEPAAVAKPSLARRILVPLILIVVVAAGGIYGYRLLHFAAGHATTDDAQLDGDISPVLPRVAGFVTRVAVSENQKVAAGDLLVEIDGRDLSARVDQARTALGKETANLASSRAKVQALIPTRDRTAGDLRRYGPLHENGEISQQEFDAARAAADGAEAQYVAAQAEVGVAQAQVAQKKSDLDYALLQLSYTRLVAPAAGVVSRKNVEVGQYVQPGQQLLSVVQDPDVWVVANFKETQLRKMKVGQKASIDVDAYPHINFTGRVESISAATGARFALLPPDNATGNFTKVVQRVPVKIVFTGAPDPAHPLRVGMSVKAVVDLD